MEFPAFIESLKGADNKETKALRTAYAVEAGTTYSHLMNNLKYARKTPRELLLNGLIAAAHGKVSREEMLDHFYPEPDKAKTA